MSNASNEPGNGTQPTRRTYDPPDYYTTEPKVARIWQFLMGLDRPEMRFIDADRPHDEVYHEILKHVSIQVAR